MATKHARAERHITFSIIGWISLETLAHERPFSDVTVGDGDAFLTFCGQRWCRVALATAAKALRAFFRYAEYRRWCAAGIAAAIESPRLFQQETLPAGPTWTEVQQLLAQPHTEQPRDIRDHAIVMLLALYGLRSGEVSALRVDQLDWAHAQITIGRPQHPCSQVYPLTQELGTALIRDLRDVRPPCERREVFLTLRAPWRPLSAGALHHLTRTRLTRVGYRGPHYGPHTLCHACTAHPVACVLSCKEIGDHLGHRSPYATRPYVKVDMQRLLPHPATYLGHVQIAAMQCYLTMTPALLQAANLRFAQYAQPEGHHG